MPTGPPDEGYFEGFPALDDELNRLRAYQDSREEEEAMVRAALRVPKDDRTQTQHLVIAHSTYGTANPHNF